MALLVRASMICACILGVFASTKIHAQCQFTITHSNSDDHCLYAEEEVVWKSNTGVSVSGNSITKNIVSGSWDAGALSVNTVKNNGWMTTVVSETNTDRMFGLSSSPSATPSFSRSQFGIYLRSDRKFAIYESGSLKGNPTGQYGDNSYAAGDVFMIKIDKGVVKYYQNSTLLMSSTATPTLPLTVDATLNSWSPASTVSQVKIVNGSDGSFTASASSPGTGATYQWYVDGSPVGTGNTYTNTTLASPSVLTCALTTGTSGCATAGTIISSNAIRFQNVAISALGDYNVLNNSLSYGCLSATEPVVFRNLVNAEATANSITKSRGSTSSFDAGAFSVNKVFNNGYVEGSISQNNRAVVFGLSSADGGVAFGSVHFAFYARNDGQLEIYESNNNRTSLGAYLPNDVLKIVVDNNIVKYYTNGTLRYSSTVTPTLPLYVDASLNDIGASVSSVLVTNATSESFSLWTSPVGSTPSYQWKVNGGNAGTSSSSFTNPLPNDGDIISCQISTGLTGCADITTSNVTVAAATFKGTAYITTSSATIACSETEEDVTFTDMVNVSATSNTVQKVLGSHGFYDAGATSLNKVYNNGYARVTAVQNNSDRYFGLSSNASASIHTNVSNTTIQYAIFLASNSTYWIYESGVYKNVNGSYNPGDQFKIKVDNNVVRYYRNSGTGDLLLYSSGVSPTSLLPLIVDVSLNSRTPVAATVDNIVVSNGSNGVFQAITANVGTSPTYQWKVNGFNDGANSPTFTKNTLVSPDAVTCFITPDITGCATHGFLSNSIKVSMMGGTASPTSTWTGTASQDWDNSLNWSNGVPRGYTKATIPSGTPNSPVLNLASAGVYDLVINSGATLTISGSNSLHVFNLWNNQGTFTANTSTVNFKTCTNNKNSIISRLPETFTTASLDNANGIDVTGEHHIKSQMTLNAIVDYTGIVSDLIVFDDNATVSGVSNASFIRGKVKKIGNDSFTFPIGKNSVYRKLSITAPTLVTDEFTAEYFQAKASAVYGNVIDPSFWTISGCEYWTLQRSGISAVNVELSWNLATGCDNPPYITSLPDLRTTYWNGSYWKDAGNGSTTGDANDGTITSSLPITSYTAFTLATVTSLNPLPIILADFDANATSGGIELLWQTETETSTDRFVVERSNASLKFEAISTVKASGESREMKRYSTIDRTPLPGKNYYRLKMFDLNGASTYSDILVMDVETEDQLSVYPNPVRQGDIAYVSKQTSKVIIRDEFMRTVREIEYPKTIDTSDLPAGIYFCFDENGNSLQRLIVSN